MSLKQIGWTQVVALASFSLIWAKTDVGTENEKVFRYIAKFKGSDERQAFNDEKDSQNLIIKSIPRSESEVLNFESLEDVANWEEGHKDLLDYLVEGKNDN